MRKIISAVFSGLIIMTLAISNTIESRAYETFDGYKLIGGIKGRYYYLDPELASNSYWKKPFINAFNNWYNTPTPFSFSQTTDIYESVIDCYFYSDANHETNAYTELFWSSTGYSSRTPQSNWLYARIYMNKAKLADDSLSYANGSIGHELGHAMGLDHETGNVLMTTAGNGRTVTVPQPDDIAGIGSLYKYSYGK